MHNAISAASKGTGIQIKCIPETYLSNMFLFLICTLCSCFSIGIKEVFRSCLLQKQVDGSLAKTLPLTAALSFRGVTGIFFGGGKLIFPDFFPSVKCFFLVENSHFGTPKTNCSGFEK